MEMNGTSDYSRVMEIYRIKAVDPATMHVYPDRRDGEGRRGEMSFRMAVKKETEKVKDPVENPERAGRRRLEEEMSPFMLWMFMSGKSRRLV